MSETAPLRDIAAALGRTYDVMAAAVRRVGIEPVAYVPTGRVPMGLYDVAAVKRVEAAMKRRNRSGRCPPMDDSRGALVMQVWDEFGRTLRRCVRKKYPALARSASAVLGDDEFEAACLRGLCLAASKYDQGRECKLITYAMSYMRSETQREIRLAAGRNSRGCGLRIVRPVGGSESQEEMSLSELAEAPPVEGPEVAESRAAVRQQVERLSPQLRQVVMHRYFFGLTLREAADRMGVSREMVRQWEMQALHHLKQRLAEDQA